MKKIICLVVFLSFFIIASGQNLIPNGNFELYSGCPGSYAQFDSVEYWFNPQQFPGPGGSPDYFNSCTFSTYIDVPQNYWGYQQAHSGVAYAGLIPWYVNPPGFREYIEVPLTSSLSPGSCYYFEMYVSICNVCRYTTDDLGIYFSDTLVAGVNNNQPLPFTPQIINSTGFITDTLNWILVSGTFTASGGENYLIIGNFNNDLSTDTLFFNSNGFHEPYFYIDDVSLSLCTGMNPFNENETGTITPNPFSDKLKILLKEKISAQIIIYDFSFRRIMHQRFTDSTVLNTLHIEKGIYYYELQTEKGVIKKGKVIKL